MAKKFTQKKEKAKPKKAPPKKIPKEKMAAYLETLEKKEQTPQPTEPATEDTSTTAETQDRGTTPQEQEDKKDEATNEESNKEEIPPAVHPPSEKTDSVTASSDWGEMEEKKKGFYWPVLLFAMLGFVIGIAFFAYQEGIKKGKSDVYTAVSPTPAPSTTPTETVVDKKAYTISVLNGSGRGGEAAKAKTLLEEEGFIVDTVGNAERSDYSDTIIQSRSFVASSYLEELTKTMKSGSYDIAEPEVLTEKGKADVIITIGRNREK